MILLLSALALAGVQGPGDAMPDRSWDVVHLDLDVRVDIGAGTVAGTATHRVTPLGRRSGTFVLNQRGLQIEKVTVQGELVEGWRTAPGVLEIPMPTRGDDLEVAVTYSARPEMGLHFRRPPAERTLEVWSQGQDEETQYWVPTVDYPSDTFTLTSHLTVPEGLLAFANGVAEGQEPADAGWTRWSYRFDQPLPAYLIAIAVGDYKVYDDSGSVPLQYIAPSWMPEQRVRDGAGQTVQVLDWFTKQLGVPFPFPIYRQAFVQDFLYGAMENSSLTIAGDEYLAAPTDDAGVFPEELLAHELAHQWFGDSATCYGWRNIWLNEAFAAYYAGLYQRDARGEAFFAWQLADWQDTSYQSKVPIAVPTWSDLDTEAADVGTVYYRGSIVLQGLREGLGAETFDRGVTLYLQRNTGRLVETTDLRRALEDVSGQHLGWYFDQFVYGTNFGEATTEWAWSDGLLTLTVEQASTTTRTWLDVEIGTATDTRTHRMWLVPGRSVMQVALPKRPTWVAVDPQSATLVKWDHKQDPAAWAAQVLHSPSPYARLVAADALAAEPETEGTLALAEVLADGDLPGHFRGRIAAALGKVATDDATKALLAQLDDPSMKLRHEVGQALGRGRAQPEVVAALEDRLHVEDSGYAAAAMLASLGTLAPESAVKAARKVLKSEPPAMHAFLQTKAADLLGERGDSKDLRRLLDLAKPGPTYGLRSSAMNAAVAIAGRDDAQRDEVQATLEAQLYDEDVRIRWVAIRSLGKLGGPTANAALLALANSTTQPSLRDLAREAARPKPPPPKKVDDGDVDDRLDDLEERLERLEHWRF